MSKTHPYDVKNRVKSLILKNLSKKSENRDGNILLFRQFFVFDCVKLLLS